MKKIVLLIAVVFNYVTATAQDFQGVAYYESKTSFDDFPSPPGREMTAEMKKRMQERMKSMFEKTYILTFNRSEATYNEEEKLETPGQGNGPRFGGFNASGDYYKNVKENRFTNQKEVFGKVFLIKDTLPNLTWQLGSETKKIGNYTCYKATAIKSVDPLDIRSMRPGPPEQEENKDKDETAEEAQDTIKRRSPLDMIEVPSEITVTAWYTPEIPVSMGPGEYNGLPGLILEISADKTTILCSKITLNPQNKATIKEPTKGKEVSQEEFAEILKEKMEEMQERFQNGGGRRGDGGRRPF